jgi:hypothetical protein
MIFDWFFKSPEKQTTYAPTWQVPMQPESEKPISEFESEHEEIMSLFDDLMEKLDDIEDLILDIKENPRGDK